MSPGSSGRSAASASPAGTQRLHHVERRDALGDADDERDARVGRFHDRVGRAGGGTKITDAFAPVSRTASATVLKTGQPSCVVPPLPGVTPPTTFVPYAAALLGVERALAAGQALDEQARVLVDQDAHAPTYFSERSPRDDFLGRLAPSVSAVVKLRPLSASICLPCSTLVPSMRTTIGHLHAEVLDRGDDALGDHVAAQDAAEDVDQHPFTFWSDIRMRNAFLICSALAPPPTSRKFAGSPPPA